MGFLLFCFKIYFLKENSILNNKPFFGIVKPAQTHVILNSLESWVHQDNPGDFKKIYSDSSFKDLKQKIFKFFKNPLKWPFWPFFLSTLAD